MIHCCEIRKVLVKISFIGATQLETEVAATLNSCDGVVPYWSSHLQGAQSELIVNSDHGAQYNPDAIRKVERILKLNPSHSAVSSTVEAPLRRASEIRFGMIRVSKSSLSHSEK
jgi:hypothetical protein